MKDKLLRSVAPRIGKSGIAALGSTLRITIDDPAGLLQDKNRGPVIWSFWHNRLFLMPYLYRRFIPKGRLVVLISRSKDGQIISDIVSHFGIRAVRGSSSKRATASFLELVDCVNRERMDAAITPDGPRGPRYQLQPGILYLSQHTQRPIVPLTYHLGKKWELNSWDRFQLPCPFATCAIRINPPVQIPLDADESQMAAFTSEIQTAMGR